MSLQVEKLEKNMAKLTIEASAEEFEAAIEKAYQKNKSKMNIQGFRKGKAPRKIIEKMYGAGVFYEEAANVIIPDAYAKAVDECDLEIVSQPSVDVVQVEAGKPFIFTAEVAVKPEVKLGDYKGIEVEKTDVEVSDDDVNAEIDRVREQNARTITVEDRAVQDKDTAVIDFEGFVDGVAFEGGKGEDYPLTIGSHSFIDNFEEQLIGKNIGEEAEVNVTFPEDYHVEDLKGKPATFKVTVKEIKAKELPELDDDFAQDVSECETVDAYKAQVKEELTKKKEDAAKAAKEDEAVAKVVENAEMEKEIIKEQKRNNIDAFIICPAPGSDTKDMLKKQCAKTPYTLIMEDVYSKEGGNSGNPVIGPDYYKIGSELGKQLGKKRQKIGVVANWKESKSDQDAIRGLKDSLKDTKSEIDWYCYRKKDQNIYEKVSKKDKVDAIVVLDPHALEELGEQSDEDSYQGADIYGIGSSVKAVVLLDNGNIQGLVVPDAYEIGYKSVGEMAQKLEHRFYRLKGHKTEIKVFDRDEFSLNDNLERFLYSYE